MTTTARPWQPKGGTPLQWCRARAAQVIAAA
jgi:hypothetical protein